VELPPHIVASELHVLLDILPPLRRHYSREDPRQRERSPSAAVDALWNYKLMVYSAQQRTVEQKCVCVQVCVCGGSIERCWFCSPFLLGPVFLQRLVALLTSEVLSNAMVSRSLAALKEEWMNKVKVLYKFSQMGHLDLPQKNERLTKLLQEILLVGHEDLPILQYWRSALSKAYKTHLMTDTKETGALMTNTKETGAVETKQQ